MDGQFSTKSNCAVLVRLWHESEVPALPAYVGNRGNTRQHMLNASSSHFTQSEHRRSLYCDAPP
jgi:hypothetical protein